jgi:type I restriction-modification system DNA methylase subunit
MPNARQLEMRLSAPYRNRTLFADHYLAHLLPADPRWDDARDEAAQVLDRLHALYTREADHLDAYNESQLEQHWFQPILHALGHTFEVQPSVPGLEAHVKRPDYVLFRDEAARQRAVTQQHEEVYAREALAVGEVKAWETPLGKKRRGGGPRFEDRNPSWQIDYYLRAAGVDWGILTNGRLWRLVHIESSQRLQIYYEVDLVHLIEQGDPGAVRYFTLFFRQAAFRPDAQGRVFLADARAASNAYAVALEEDLQANVYRALEHLIQGFLDLPRNELGPDDLTAIYDNSLYLLYRLLFILYGESRGLLPMRNEAYRDHYSLAAIKQDVAEGGIPRISGTTSLWGRLQTLFHIINGDDAGVNRDLGVPRYNGGLFDPQQHPFLAEKAVGDRALVDAIDLLSRRETEDGREFADYRTLNVRHLGSIYQGLLEYRPRVAEGRRVAVRDGGEERWVPADAAPEGARVVDRRREGEIYLETDRGERKATGSYYTPQYIVEYIVAQTMGPLVEEATVRAKARAEAGGVDPGEALVDEVLALKVLDPAMGSGHFLVEATNYLALALATDPFVTTEETPEEDLTYWRRRVVERCIYGVDKNPLAVELAKLSLWLTTVAADRPLSFLDHHLKCGDSLIGAQVADLGWAPPPVLDARAQKRVDQAKAGQMNMFGYMLSQRLPTVMSHILEIVGQESTDYETVQAKEAADHAVRALKAPFEAVADLWISAYFGHDFTVGQYQEALGLVTQPEAVLDLEAVRAARSMAEARRFFHWELAFPEVFYDRHGQPLGERAGFDAVVGNPPYGAKLKQEETSYLMSVLSLQSYQLDTYLLFVEKGLDIASDGGFWGMIIPNTWLLNLHSEKIRKHLFEETTVESLVHYQYSVFPEATVDTEVAIFKNEQPNQANQIGIHIVERDGQRHSYLIPQRQWRNRDGKPVNILEDPRVAKIADKLREFDLLDELAVITQGAKPFQVGKGTPPQTRKIVDEKPFVSEASRDSTFRPLLRGSLIQRYEIDWNDDYWVSFGDWLAEPRYSASYDSPAKIVIRQTGDSLVAALDTDQFIVRDNLYTIVSRRESLDLRYILALLNSTMLNWFYQKVLNPEEGEALAQVKRGHLAQLRLRDINFTTPIEDRDALVAEATSKADDAIEALATSSALRAGTPMDRALLAQAASPALDFVAARLDADPEQADVVHDLLAHLAERMIALHAAKQDQVEAFWLDLEGVTDAETFEALKEHGKWASSLAKTPACRPFVDADSRSTRHLDESLAWNEDCFKAFVKMLAGRVAALSDVVAVYRAHHADQQARVHQIAATDWLIDQVVYRLYGLTADEVAVVEERD